MSKSKHLSLSDRTTIQSGLNQNKSFRQIAVEVNKDPTTISKEIRNHLQRIRSGAYGRPHNSCMHQFTCDVQGVCHKPGCTKELCRRCASCNTHCSKYVEENCLLRSKPPYVCNGCNKKLKCTLYKFEYHAHASQKEYETLLVSSRTGCNMDAEEMERINQLVSPLLDQGQAPYHIWVHNRNELMIDSRTLYNYINKGYLQSKRIDLPRAVKYKPRRVKPVLKVDKQCRAGRNEEDFARYLEENPDIHYVEMDTVEGRKGGKVLLTIQFPQSCFMLAFLRDKNDAQSVIDIINGLYALLGHHLFTELFPIILLDNGSEFSNPLDMEFADPDHTIRRTRVFYTRPSTPSDKPHVEKNHVEFRKVCPKGTSLDDFTQATVNTVFSHVNSYSRKKLNSRSPHQSFSSLFKNVDPSLFGIQEIPPNEVILNPKLLKK